MKFLKKSLYCLQTTVVVHVVVVFFCQQEKSCRHRGEAVCEDTR